MKLYTPFGAVLGILFGGSTAALAQGTAFTYQGRLNDSASPANGSYDLKLTLYDSVSGGLVVAGPLTNAPTAVSNGLFTVMLDFGTAAFTGPARWLEIGVRSNGSAVAYLTLNPRQALTAVPYAVTAGNLTGFVPASALSGAYPGALTLNNPGNQFSGAFTGNGGGLTNISAVTLGGLSAAAFWQISGNSGTSPGNGNFLGTTDPQPLELRAGGMRVLRLEPDLRGASAGNLIGGFTNNMIQQPNSGGDVIAGGGFSFGPNVIYSNSSGAFIGAGSGNQIGPNVNDAVIGGGQGNTIQTYVDHGAIGGGFQNSIQEFANYATIAGGYGNVVGWNLAAVGGGYENTNQSYAAAIGGGSVNTIQYNASYSFIGAGYSNSIAQNSGYSAIGGGGDNAIQTGAGFSVLGGGYYNAIGGSNYFVALGGGASNSCSGYGATLPGGILNNVNGSYATVGGGSSNSVLSSGAMIGGGNSNSIQFFSGGAFIGGGLANNIQSNSGFCVLGGGESNNCAGLAATVSGGYLNSATSPFATVNGGALNIASAANATVPGGSGNTAAGIDSFAAGSGARALHDSSFVWSDGTTTFSTTATNQFLIRAAGGVGMGLNSPQAQLEVSSLGGNFFPQAQLDQQNTSDYARLRFTVGGNSLQRWDVAATGTNFLIFSGAIGATMLYLDHAGLTVNGTFVSSSDRNAKQDFGPVNTAQILDKVATLPISQWSYKTDGATRHIGPMAQDFYAAFNVGPDDKHIAVVDEGGVALAAIQSLNQKLTEQLKARDAQLEELRQKTERLEELTRRLAERLDARDK
jgi:hypothetical protein